MDRRLKNDGTWLIHGHTHSEKIVNGNQICVCAEACNGIPVSRDEILNIIENNS